MKVYSRGVARIRHKNTGDIYDVESDELDWDAVGADERQMGLETRYEALVEHPELGRLTWSLWEYPAGIENYNQTNVGEHELLADFEYGLEHEPEPDVWADYSLPDNPFTIFMDSYHHTGDLLADYGSENGAHLVNRMIFSHQVTALEAYLSDTLTKAVLADRTAKARLMSNDAELSKERFSLAEIASDPGLVESKVREYLRSILYHNLPKVDFLYSTALGIRILGLAKDKALLFKAVMQRHDCVHRNGIDRDGQRLEVFTKRYVQDTADLIKAFVMKIENEVRSRSVPSS
ncbi:hypothetical protein [Bradyrhizobium sp. CCGUVB23]|uniref:hypothetical protein n=1 Tax=Bradyrhizobium sp. CCGUVB23 TaxID=2949630 RepID=UPI0020B3155D|nr:hypothetical protein [Bradyrhizobium sp. CCGUVB23]MCP3468205.1 hypothetical protein [Bradyrhizobium sp. CCGUVB23]